MKNSVIVLITLCILGSPAASASATTLTGPCQTIEQNFRTEANRLFTQGKAAPEYGKRFYIHGTVNEYLSDSPPLDPNDPRFHAGNALMWQEQVMKTFAVVGPRASPSFRKLGLLFYGKDDMLIRPAGRIAAMEKELRALGPKNGSDQFVLNYVLLVLSDHAEYARVSDRLWGFCKELSEPVPLDSERRREIAQQMLGDASKLRALAYRPKFSLRDTPRLLAMASAFAKVAQSIGVGFEARRSPNR